MTEIDNQTIKHIMKAFPKSFINSNLELILIPKTNAYFNLRKCNDKTETIATLLEATSRDCCKTEPYVHLKRNMDFWEKNRECVYQAMLNAGYHGIEEFTQSEMELIYQKIGNGVNHELAVKFVKQDFDMNVLSADGGTA